jgi:hypothetical protein
MYGNGYGNFAFFQKVLVPLQQKLLLERESYIAAKQDLSAVSDPATDQRGREEHVAQLRSEGERRLAEKQKAHRKRLRLLSEEHLSKINDLKVAKIEQVRLIRTSS